MSSKPPLNTRYNGYRTQETNFLATLSEWPAANRTCCWLPRFQVHLSLCTQVRIDLVLSAIVYSGVNTNKMAQRMNPRLATKVRPVERPVVHSSTRLSARPTALSTYYATYTHEQSTKYYNIQSRCCRRHHRAPKKLDYCCWPITLPGVYYQLQYETAAVLPSAV